MQSLQNLTIDTIYKKNIKIEFLPDTLKNDIEKYKNIISEIQNNPYYIFEIPLTIITNEMIPIRRHMMEIDGFMELSDTPNGIKDIYLKERKRNIKYIKGEIYDISFSSVTGSFINYFSQANYFYIFNDSLGFPC
jgi:hypothetical protein